MGLITKTTLPDFIESFADPYAAVRLQACKVACKLKSDDRDLIGALLDSFSDSSWQIRAFAIKGMTHILMRSCWPFKESNSKSKVKLALVYDA
jgi:hypothetical protein